MMIAVIYIFISLIYFHDCSQILLIQFSVDIVSIC